MAVVRVCATCPDRQWHCSAQRWCWGKVYQNPWWTEGRRALLRMKSSGDLDTVLLSPHSTSFSSTLHPSRKKNSPYKGSYVTSFPVSPKQSETLWWVHCVHSASSLLSWRTGEGGRYWFQSVSLSDFILSCGYHQNLPGRGASVSALQLTNDKLATRFVSCGFPVSSGLEERSFVNLRYFIEWKPWICFIISG